MLSLIFPVTTQSVNISKTRAEMPIKVEHPQIYELLVLQYDLLDELFPNWPRSASVSEYSADDIVCVTVRFLVPIDSSSINMHYSFRLLMRFQKFSLTNELSIREAAESYQKVLSHMERHQAIKLFRTTDNIDYAELYWDRPSYGLVMRSPAGDTIIYQTYWSDGPKNEWFRMFNLTNPKLLNRLEWFLSRFPVPQVTEFRERLGIGYARLDKNYMFVSSGTGCDNRDAYFLAGHSLKFVASYKLPVSYDWPGFPYYADAMGFLDQYIRKNQNIDCAINSAADSAFVIMSFQPNSLPGHIYIPVRCVDNKIRLVSVDMSLIGSEGYRPILHELSVTDSLQIGCP